MKRKTVLGVLVAAALLLAVPGLQVHAETGTQEVTQDTTIAGKWSKWNGRWWYEHTDGSYTQNAWEQIHGTWYYFDSQGYMKTGWLNYYGSWYYLGTKDDGAMKTGWQQVGGTWYYMYDSGVMAANTWIGDYYVNNSGAWVVGKVKPQPKWIKSGFRWWYCHSDGSYTTNGWEYIGNTWYYFDGAGWMQTGWLQTGGHWYYLGGANDGAMKTGWQQVKNVWYYMYESGEMAADTWIGEYYVNADGAWDPNRKPAAWVQEPSGNWWYRHEDGSFTQNGWETIDGKTYYFNENGWCLTNRWIGATGVGGYYVDASGARLENGSYSVDGLYYTFDANGLCTAGNSRFIMVTDPINGQSYKVEHQYATDPQVTEDQLLAAAVYAEAGNQQMPGMTGVALVILNRMYSGEYPASAACVIYQANQFQVARDGALNKWLNNINSSTLNDAKTAVSKAKAIMAEYQTNGTPRTVEGLTMPNGKTDFNYLGFMTPAAFEQCNLDPVATEAFIWLNTEFYTRWITKK